MMPHWIEGKVISQKQWGEGLFSLYVDAPITPFIAGQFLQIGLDVEGKKFFRPYSIASSPAEKTLEFYYNLVPEGHFTPHLVRLGGGDPVWVGKKPAGHFVLSEIPSAPILWLLATGTGLAPFLSLLKTTEIWTRFEKIVLIHSVRRGAWLTHQEQIDQWQKKAPQQFYWIPIVTREPWPGALSQRLDGLLQSKTLETMMDLDLAANNSQVMLCGNPEMIKSVTHILKERGLQLNRPRQPGQITFENYWK